MKKKSAKFMAAIPMVATIILPITALAEYNTYSLSQTDLKEGTTSKEVTVTYEQASTFSVTIPKTITLGDKEGEYKIKVVGDLSSDKKVTVTPQDDNADLDGINFKMSDTSNMGTSSKKADVWATVIQDDVSWSSKELEDASATGVEKSGSITGSSLTSGSWSGNLTFKIALTDADVE
jgi:hypothetical protein